MDLSRRARWFGAAWLALALVWLMYVTRWVDPGQREDQTTASSSMASPVAPPARSAAPPRPPGASRERGPTLEQVALIEQVHVQPSRLCAGRDVLVRVETTLRHGDLKLAIAGRAQNPAVLRFPLPGKQTLSVVARSWGLQYDLREIPLQIEDCGGPARLSLEVRPSDAEPSTLQFSLRGLNDPDAEVRWQFGDGSREQRGGARAEHSYFYRKQAGSAQSYVVTARVYRGGVQQEEVLASVALTNREWLTRPGSGYTLPSRPRGAPREVGGMLLAAAEVVNLEEREAVTLHTAQLTAWSCGATPQQMFAERPASAVLDAVQLPAAQARDLALHIERSWFPEPACVVLAQLQGTSDTGRAVGVTIPIELAAPLGWSETVEDVELSARIVRASTLLGRSRVTPRELQQLVEQGQIP